MGLSLGATFILSLVRNHLVKEGPNCVSDFRYVNSPTERMAANARVKGARRVTVS